MSTEVREDSVIDVAPRIPLRRRIGNLLHALWNSLSAEDSLFFIGLAFVGYGTYQFQPALASIIVGVLLILLVRPMRRFF